MTFIKENWYPVCIMEPHKKQFGYSALGYILPCCWCDVTDDEGFKELKNEKLKLSNVQSIKDIIYSKEWKKFIKKLVLYPETAPKTCHKYCCGLSKERHARSSKTGKSIL